MGYGLNFYIPISRVDENFHCAHKRNAVNTEKFWWRRCSATNSKLKMSQLTITQILNGTNECRDLLTIIDSYLEVIGCDGQTLRIVRQYLDLVKNRANGKIWTHAKWQRNFVKNHQKYGHDSNLTMEICRDLVQKQRKIVNGEEKCKELLGNDVDFQKRYFKMMPLKYICNPSTANKLLSRL